jgi:hypothetical protein
MAWAPMDRECGEEESTCIESYTRRALGSLRVRRIKSLLNQLMKVT